MPKLTLGSYTLPHMFLQTLRRVPQRSALGFKHGAVWTAIDYQTMAQRITQVIQCLLSLGIEAGFRVAILSENRPEWPIIDFALQFIGAINVPLYHTLSEPQLHHLLTHSGTSLLVVSGGELFKKAAAVADMVPSVRHIIHMDRLVDPPHDKKVLFLEDQLARFAPKGIEFLESLAQAVDPKQCASIVYTSGTTGDPKGVMLSQQNFCANVEGATEALPFLSEQDRVLSFLPLSHVFERTCGYYTVIGIGGAIYYAEALEKVADNMQEVQPTVVVSVPRLFEKMHATILEKVEAAGRRPLFDWAIARGKAMMETPAPSPWVRLQYALASRLIFFKLRQRTGGHLKCFISGGAPLQKSLGEFFKYAGLDIVEGYGLTESAPVLSCNRIGALRFGSIGLPLFNVEVRVEADGELLAKGPNIMLGYYQNPSATRQAFSDDGWLRTGDLARIDSDGYIWITGRKKQILVLSNGKNVSPEPIENALGGSRLIEQAILVGDNRNYVLAIVVPAEKHFRLNAGAHGVAPPRAAAPLAELLGDAQVQEWFMDEVKRCCAPFARFEQPKRLLLRGNPFTPEEGTLTPSLKIIRGKVMERLKSDIDAIYAQEVSDIAVSKN